MHKTNISWTNFASNPIRAINIENDKVGWYCTKVSDGCANCYSETLNIGRSGNGLAYTVPNRSKARFVLIEKEFDEWQRRRKPTMIFVCDMTDLFHEDVPDEFIGAVWAGMAVSRHVFQILTKRPERMLRWCNKQTALKNVWLGVSIENQRAADERIPLLLQTPAAVRFLSCEPLLGQIDFFNADGDGLRGGMKGQIHQIIVGGESGKNFRAMNPDWARSVHDQCKSAGIPFFYKQTSGMRPGTEPALDGIEYHEFPQ